MCRVGVDVVPLSVCHSRAEILGVSREEILQLLERPPAEEEERRLVDELGEVVLGD